jgi:uncharacterized membrane protein YedE/YeeE
MVVSRVAAFVCGLVFALGLAVSGMTHPSKVVAFLDVTGAWDPSLALVMIGALGVHVGFVALARRRGAPVMAGRFDWPEATRIDGTLVGGAAIFGVGWGLSGFCPGPAIVSLAALAPKTLAFFAAMGVGLVVVRVVRRRLSPAT